MLDNLHIYNQARAVPPEALSQIKGGRMSGKSDINPMWRIKRLTEMFGPCGIGWKYKITKQWLEPGANNEVAAFVNIDLHVKHEGEWSEAIPGTGGNAFVAKEKNGMYVNDECFKMALTDAISVSCKALGIAADIYWNTDRTKYTGRDAQEGTKTGRKTQQHSDGQQQNTAANFDVEKARKTLFANINDVADKSGVDKEYAISLAKRIIYQAMQVTTLTALTEAQWRGLVNNETLEKFRVRLTSAIAKSIAPPDENKAELPFKESAIPEV